MSWGTCYAGSNNIHFNFPPIMDDGRNYASWAPDAYMNQQIKDEANIKSNWNYRLYLQTNAAEIMRYNTSEACYALGTSPNYSSMLPNTLPGSPYVFGCEPDSNNPSYGYQTSDLKNPYLSREQLYSKMISPSIPSFHFENMKTKHEQNQNKNQ